MKLLDPKDVGVDRIFNNINCYEAEEQHLAYRAKNVGYELDKTSTRQSILF